MSSKSTLLLHAASSPIEKNRGKMLVSLCTVSYHISLLLNDNNLLQYSWDVAMNFFQKLIFNDVIWCLLKNVEQPLSLSCDWIVVDRYFSANSPSEILRALMVLESMVVQHCLSSQATRRYATQENHLLFMRDLQSELKTVFDGSRSDLESSASRLAQFLNHSSSKSLTALIERRLYGAIGWTPNCLSPLWSVIFWLFFLI